MADNTRINLNQTAGDIIAADEVAGVKHQRVKCEFGIDGSATDVSLVNPMPVSTHSTSTVPLILSRFLDTNGDGTGTKNALGDYGSSSQIFRIKPGAGVVYRINRIIIHLDDVGSITSGGYGAMSALTNGVKISILNTSDADIVDLTDGVPVKANGDFAAYCHDLSLQDFGGGVNMFTVRWTFGNHGTFVRLDGDAGESLAVTLNDSFTGLVEHRFMAQGYIETTTT